MNNLTNKRINLYFLKWKPICLKTISTILTILAIRTISTIDSMWVKIRLPVAVHLNENKKKIRKKNLKTKFTFSSLSNPFNLHRKIHVHTFINNKSIHNWTLTNWLSFHSILITKSVLKFGILKLREKC